VWIPEEMIMDVLGFLLDQVDADTKTHQMHVVAAKAGGVGPLGLPVEGKLETSAYMIAVDETGTVETWITRAITVARLQHARRGDTIQFAALSQSMWMVATEHFDALARKLMHEGRLYEHPHVADVALVYGVARDGRRWRSRRWLTGERAGTTDQVELLVGRPDDREWYGMPVVPHLLRLVGVG
jgi:hypothetical protein